MTQKCDVLVIGAGVIGVCAAHYLLEAGLQPLVVDKGEICAGASYANGGLVAPSSWTPVTYPGVARALPRWMRDASSPVYAPLASQPAYAAWWAAFLRASRARRWTRATRTLRQLAARSVDLYRALAEARDPNDGFGTRGSLQLFLSAAGFRQGAQQARAHRASGAAAAVLGPEAVQTRMPWATAAVVGGILYPQDGQVSPDAFVKGLAAHVKRRGGRFQTHTEALEVEAAGDRLRAVRTTRGVVECQAAVLAAGAWSGRLGRALGLRIPVQPAKGYSYTLPRPPHFPDMPVALSESKVFVNPLGSLLRVAGTLEFSGFDDRLYPRRARLLSQATQTYLGFACEPDAVEIWRGWRPMTPDGVPIICRSPRYRNLALATGHNMIGMTLGPVTGQLVARILQDEPLGFEARDLDLSRFA